MPYVLYVLVIIATHPKGNRRRNIDLGYRNAEVKFLGLVAEPARPAEAEAGCLSGPAGLGGITSLIIIPAYMLRLRHQS